MKSVSKIIISLVLIILFLVACGVIMTIGYVGIWLHTYRAFTERKPVAIVEISEQKEDEHGKYTDVRYTPIKQESAVVKFLFDNPDTEESDYETESVLEFKLYGDSVHIGGPIIKFKDELILLNFDSIYKVGKIFARYNIDNDEELNRNDVQRQKSSYDLNGGIDANWKDVHDNLTQDGLRGSVYRKFVDTTQLDVPGQFVGNKSLKYTLYITNNGFLWELIEE